MGHVRCPRGLRRDRRSKLAGDARKRDLMLGARSFKCRGFAAEEYTCMQAQEQLLGCSLLVVAGSIGLCSI